MSERSLKDRVDRLERIVGERLNIDFDEVEADEEHTREAFAEANPDHADTTEASDEDKEAGEAFHKAHKDDDS